MAKVDVPSGRDERHSFIKLTSVLVPAPRDPALANDVAVAWVQRPRMVG